MKVLRNSNEDEMILEFLKGELSSERFNKSLLNTLDEFNLNSDIILNGDISISKQNQLRKKVIKNYRGYPDERMFEKFPKNIKWKYVEFELKDIDKIYYINYDYWNELSNNTSKPTESAKNIKKGKEIFGVSNQPFIDGINKLENQNFPPIIILTCNKEKYLIIEGHSRMTIYGLNPSKFTNTYGFVGYSSEDEMKNYDIRMI